MSLVVLKVGGNAAPSAARTVTDLVFQEHKVVLVHGAGPQITAEMERRGLAVEFVGGRRRTSGPALEVVRRSLAEVNAALCAAIGARALPLPGGALACSGAKRWRCEGLDKGSPAALFRQRHQAEDFQRQHDFQHMPRIHRDVQRA